MSLCGFAVCWNPFHELQSTHKSSATINGRSGLGPRRKVGDTSQIHTGLLNKRNVVESV